MSNSFYFNFNFLQFTELFAKYNRSNNNNSSNIEEISKIQIKAMEIYKFLEFTLMNDLTLNSFHWTKTEIFNFIPLINKSQKLDGSSSIPF